MFGANLQAQEWTGFALSFRDVEDLVLMPCTPHPLGS